MGHFEIQVLNYNGRQHLAGCLGSLARLEPNGHSYNVTVVDNGSSDDSRQFVEREFHQFKFLALKNNYGYSQGNNLGAQNSVDRLKKEGRRSDYQVFLNNDTEVDPNWLAGAAEQLSSDPKLGILGSKALFMDRFAVLRISVSPQFEPSLSGSLDRRALGAYLVAPPGGENVNPDARRIRWRNAFNRENGGRWLAPLSYICFPILDPSKPARVSIHLRFAPEHGPRIKLECFSADDQTALFSRICRGGEELALDFAFSPRNYVSVLQNFGSFVTEKWDAGDIGFGQIDNGDFTCGYESPAVCGVSMFVRQELWDKLGGFDANYFAYFEDTDLSVRARLLGYKCAVSAQSVLRHLHCGSIGGEWSTQFNRLVAYSHLLFCSKFAPKHLWNMRLAELSKSAWEQFELYVADRELNSKAQLQAYLRKLKHPWVYWKNRMFRYAHRTELDNFPFLDTRVVPPKADSIPNKQQAQHCANFN